MQIDHLILRLDEGVTFMVPLFRISYAYDEHLAATITGYNKRLRL